MFACVSEIDRKILQSIVDAQQAGAQAGVVFRIVFTLRSLYIVSAQ